MSNPPLAVVIFLKYETTEETVPSIFIYTQLERLCYKFQSANINAVPIDLQDGN